MMYEELMELRKKVKGLERRNSNLERQNLENHHQMNFIGNNEPSRPVMIPSNNKDLLREGFS